MKLIYTFALALSSLISAPASAQQACPFVAKGPTLQFPRRLPRRSAVVTHTAGRRSGKSCWCQPPASRRAMTWTRLAAAVAVAILVPGTPARAQTLPLPPGAGFTWERVGDVVSGGYDALWFDAGGTLWNADVPLRWLDRSQGGAGRWVFTTPPLPQPSGRGILTLGPHPTGGPARADTLIVTAGYTRRSTNGGATYDVEVEAFDWALAEIPPGVPHARRVLAGNEGGYSDDRGAT